MGGLSHYVPLYSVFSLQESDASGVGTHFQNAGASLLSQSLPILTRISRPSSDSCVSNNPWISRLHLITTVMMFFSCLRSTFHRASSASPWRDRHTGGLLSGPGNPSVSSEIYTDTYSSDMPQASPWFLWGAFFVGTQAPRHSFPTPPISVSPPYLQILRCLLQKSTLLRKKENKVNQTPVS